jgi:predicted phage terminase large subunit-like protein
MAGRKQQSYGKPGEHERVKAERARRDLAYFFEQAWQVIEPATPFIANWHISAICEHLEAVSRGEIQQLLITMPPRHAKSSIVSVAWPAWVWITHPHIRWLFASYALSLSIRDNRKCRQIIESPWYQRNFGRSFRLSDDQNQKIRYENDHLGYRIAASTTSSVTGEGGDVIVVDDPINAKDADSVVMREAAIDWWDRTMSTRVNNPKKDAKVIVQQRLHQQDLAGHVLEQGGWEHLCLPTEFEPLRRCYTPVAGKVWKCTDPRKEEGELLWPARFGAQEVVKAKKQLGPIGYAGQHQQSPTPASGALWRKEWFRRYRLHNDLLTLETPTEEKHYSVHECRRFATVDIASRKTELADYTVISTWLRTPGNELVLRDVIRQRMTNPEQQDALIAAHRRWRYESIHVESVNYQIALVQQCIIKGVPVLSFEPASYGDKVARASTATIFYRNGMIYHPHEADWLEDVEQELLLFPKAAHDDVVDTISMAAILLFDDSPIPFVTASTDSPSPHMTEDDALALLRAVLNNKKQQGNLVDIPDMPAAYVTEDEQMRERQEGLARTLNLLSRLGR